MKQLTIGYMSFQRFPEELQEVSQSLTGGAFEFAFRSIPKSLDPDALAECDFLLLRSRIYRWDWLEALLQIKGAAPKTPVILMVPEGSLKEGCRIIRTTPAVVLMDSPEHFVKTVTRVVESRRKAPRQILFVDDDKNILAGYKHAFFRSPWKIHMASSAQMALEMLSMDAMDLVITDIKMPGMHGIELIEAIRKIDKSMPIIVCSGYHGLRADSDMFFHNISAFVEKPVEMPVLKAKIEEVLH